MLAVLRDVRKKVVIGFVGGSDLVKITEQLQVPGIDGAFSVPSPPSLTLHTHIQGSDLLQCSRSGTMASRRTG